MAQHIHEVIRETVRALRALPDFSRSPTSTQTSLQNLLASKRCRPKHREKLANVRPLASRPRNPDPQPCRPLQSSHSQPGGYMEMKTERGNDCSLTAGCGNQSWEPSQDEEEEEERKQGRGYMMMSPHSSPVPHQDDYMTMASPVRQDWPGFSFHSSFNSNRWVTVSS